MIVPVNVDSLDWSIYLAPWQAMLAYLPPKGDFGQGEFTGTVADVIVLPNAFYHGACL